MGMLRCDSTDVFLLDLILQSKPLDNIGVRSRNVARRRVIRINNQSTMRFYILGAVSALSKNPPVTALSN